MPPDLVKSDVAEGATNTTRPLTQPTETAEGGLAVDATQTPEEWRPALGFEGLYEVSNLGKVRSVDRHKMFRDGQFRRGCKGRELKPWLVRGYPSVALIVGKRQRKTYVHTLVCEAFHGVRPLGMEVRHLNGNRRDSRAENLAWGTTVENHADKKLHGTSNNANTNKTHCVNGHEFTVENTRVAADGSRRSCRACARNGYLKRWRETHPGQDVPVPTRSDDERSASCIQGHSYEEFPPHVNPRGWKQCRECGRIRAKQKFDRLKLSRIRAAERQAS